MSPVFRIMSSTLSGVKPNWVRMNAGDLSSLTARRKENTGSSAVIGLPEANSRSGRIVNVKVLPSSETSQDSAMTPKMSLTSFTS